MNVPQPLENIFASELIKDLDFYQLDRGHRKHDGNGSHNYPFIRFDIRHQLWGVAPDALNSEKGFRLEERIMDRYWEDLDSITREHFEEMHGYPITTDMNGYRMILLAPIYDLWEKREELEKDLDYLELGDEEGKEDILHEISEIDEEEIRIAKAYQAFIELVESLKNYFEDYVLITDGEDYDYVHKEWYNDYLKEEGWKLVEEEKVIA